VFNLVNVEGATCKWPWLVVIQVVICPAGSQCGRSRTQTLTIHETSPTVFSCWFVWCAWIVFLSKLCSKIN